MEKDVDKEAKKATADEKKAIKVETDANDAENEVEDDEDAIDSEIKDALYEERKLDKKWNINYLFLIWMISK